MREQTPDPAADRAAGERAVAELRSPPPLATLATAAALVELALSRLLWYSLGSGESGHGTVLALHRLGVLDFPRNLAAVACLTSLVCGFTAFVRLPGHAPLGRRLGAAAFAGILVPGFVIATFLPYAAVRDRLVLLALVGTNVLVVLLGWTAAAYRAGAGLRAALALLAGSGLIALVGQLLLYLVGGAGASPQGLLGSLSLLLRANGETTVDGFTRLSEATWLAGLVVAAVAVLWGSGGPGGRRRLALGISLGALLSLAALGAHDALGHAFVIVLYGTFRLQALAPPGLLAVPLAFGLAAALVALSRPDPAGRQLALGLALWVAAGHAPTRPFQLLYLLVSVLLLSRGAQALDPVGAWRRRRPWQRLVDHFDGRRTS